MKKTVQRKRGFTMIEMLVVIAAIVIISGLLFPMFKKVRESGQKIKCLNNLRQLGVALNLYMEDDAQGRFPGWPGGAVDIRELPGLLWPYLGQENISVWRSGELDVVECPSNNLTTDDGKRKYGDPDEAGCIDLVDYSINDNLWGQVAAAKVGNATIAVILYDYGVDNGVSMHLNGSNFLFVDGHAQWLKRDLWNKSWPNVDQYSGTKYDDWGII